MSKVDLVATQGFSYATRRLKAGDTFTVDAPMARVLVGIGKAERAREPGRVAAPPPELLTRAMGAAPPLTPAPAPAAVSAVSTAAVAPTKPRASRRKRTTKRGK